MSVADSLLTERQVDLLNELSGAVGICDVEKEACDVDFEGFYKHWFSLRLQRQQCQEDEKHVRWEWIEQMHEVCTHACGELDSLLSHLSELDLQRQDVMRKTTALHEQCEQMVRDQEQLSGFVEAVAGRLDFFDRVADVARVLDHANPDFGSVLDQLDGSIAFLETHYEFAQSQAYMHQFEHLRNRACIAMRSALQKSLEKSASQVEQLQQAHRRIETQAFYTRFRTAALNYKPMMSLLHHRVDVHETYTVTLEELEGYYVHLRIRLVSSPVTAHIQELLHDELPTSQLALATRQAANYIIDVSYFERQCFEAYFELRQPQESLRTLLETVADVFYRTLRPIVLQCTSIDSLREMADCLQMDIMEPNQQSTRASELRPVLSVVFQLHKDVQEKLIFRTQTYIRDEIKGYRILNGDLNYPVSLLHESEEGVNANAKFQRGWFPTMQRTLAILAKIYRVLEMSTFQGLAQEAVDTCIVSLKQVAMMLLGRSSGVHAMAPMAQMMDHNLFLIKHLLILREQVAAFDCDLVSNERFFDFSNVWEALHMKLPDGLLGVLKPKMSLSQVDSKKDIEAELKGACEALITNLTATVCTPLATVGTQVTEPMLLEFAQEVVNAFLSGLRERIPFIAAHLRVYLTAPGTAGETNQSTASILFKPVQIRLVDSWGRLESLLEEQQLTDKLEGGFLRPDDLSKLISSLFSCVMNAPWSEVVDIVSQVPREQTSLAEPEALARTSSAIDGSEAGSIANIVQADAEAAGEDSVDTTQQT